MADLNRFWQARPDLIDIWTKAQNLQNGIPPENPDEEAFLRGIVDAFGGDIQSFVQSVYQSNPEQGNMDIGNWEAQQGIPLNQMTGTPPEGYGAPPPPPTGGTTPPPATNTGTTPPPATNTGTTPPPATNTGSTFVPLTPATATTNPQVQAYLAAHPDVLNNWNNARQDPNSQAGKDIAGYGSIEKYAAANAMSFGTANDRAWASPIISSLAGNTGTTSTGTTGTTATTGTTGTSTTTGTTGTGTGTIIRDANGNPVRDLAAEGVATQEAALRLAPGWAAAYQQFAPQYAQTDLNVMGQSLFGPGFTGNLSDINKRLTEEAITQTNTGNRAARQAGVADIFEFGGQLNQAKMDLNPALWANLDQLDAQARSGVITESQYQKALGDIFKGGISTAPVSADQISTPGAVSAQNVGLMSNPWLTNAANAQRGTSALGGDLSAMARQQLALGAGLSEEQKRNASQAAREAWGARGLINSTGAVAGEILNRDAYGQQLLNQRQGFAQNVEQLGQSQQGINDAHLANVLGQLGTRTGQDLAAQQANQAAGLNAAQFNAQTGMAAQQANQAANLNAAQFNAGLTQADRTQQLALGQSLAGLQNTQQQQNFNNLMSQTQLRAQNQNDPFAILSIGTANQGTNQALGGMGGAASSGAYGNQSVYQQFNPFSSYGSDVFNTNYNAGESRYLNEQNNAANLAAAQTAASATKNAGIATGLGSALGSTVGSIFGPVGTVLGGALGGLFKCWVAREVFGADNPKWLLFRTWLEQKAPKWFHDLYVKHGEEFAVWLHRNQWAKPPIRWWMESRIATLEQSHYLEVN